MNNKEIQEQRMRGYFIQATKDILKDNGLRDLSVRNIAKRAGYSYTTMYNYFRHVNELVFLCVEDFLAEIEEFADARAKKGEKGKEKLRTRSKAYAGYFVEYPGIFDLYFLAGMNEFGHKRKTIELIENSYSQVSQEAWNECVEAGEYTEEEALAKQKQLYYTTIGVLLLYLNRQTPIEYSDFIGLLDKQIQNVLP